MPAFGGFWPRWRLALGPAAVRGVLCFGPNRGRKITYASPSPVARRPGAPGPGPRRSWTLLRAYLAAYGPATPAHLARWLATSPAWTSELFERADLDEVELDGEPAWVWRGDTDVRRARAPPAVRLLPYFDAFQVGSQPRALLFPGRASRAGAGAAPRPATTRCCCSTASSVGSGTRSGPGKRVAVTVEPLGRLTRGPARRARRVEVAADRRDRRGATPELTVGPVSVGPHA